MRKLNFRLHSRDNRYARTFRKRVALEKLGRKREALEKLHRKREALKKLHQNREAVDKLHQNLSKNQIYLFKNCAVRVFVGASLQLKFDLYQLHYYLP